MPQAQPPYSVNPVNEDTGVDLNLLKTRGDNVIHQKGAFWQKAGKPVLKPGQLRNRVLAGLAVVVLFAAAVSWFLIFRIRSIYIDGLVTISESYAASLSGVKLGDSSLTVNEKAVAARIDADRYLIYRGMERRWDGVLIRVKERIPAAVLKYSGIYYTIDRSSMVLEESDSKPASGLPEVSGIKIAGRNGCRVGAVLNIVRENSRNGTQKDEDGKSQLGVMEELLLELKVQRADTIVTIVKMSDMENILLATGEGYNVRIGDQKNLRAKLKAFLLVRQDLLQRGSGSGTIDVSVPEAPTFIPEN